MASQNKNYQHWHGYPDKRYGYGRHLEGYLSGVPKNVVFDPKASVSVNMNVPNAAEGWWEGQYKACFTMWETDTIPSWFLRYLPLYDHIIVPCDHNVELFSRHHPRVSKAQEGIDTKLFRPTDVPRLDKFQFRAAGSLWYRKGFDVLVDVFNKLKLPDAELHIKAAPHARDTPTTNLGPNIYLHRQWMTEQEQVEWFAQADCMVAPSRGEGWGLIPMQTIAMGIPTIMTLTTGHLEFAHLATGTVSCGFSQSPTLGGWWSEPNREELAAQMLAHYNNRDTFKQQAMTNVSSIAKYTWKEASRQLLACLPVGELLDTDQWEESFVTIEVRALRKVTADIHKRSIRQNAGDVFSVTDGEYQVLFDAGMVEAI